MDYFGSAAILDPVITIDGTDYGTIICLNDYPKNHNGSYVITSGKIKSGLSISPKNIRIVCEHGKRLWSQTEYTTYGNPFECEKISLCGGNICSSPEPMHVPLSYKNTDATTGQQTLTRAQVGDVLQWENKGYLITDARSFDEPPGTVDWGDDVPPDVPSGFSSGDNRGNYYDALTIYDPHDNFLGLPGDDFYILRSAWADSREPATLEYCKKSDGVWHTIPAGDYLIDKVAGWVLISQSYSDANFSSGVICFKISAAKIRRYNSVNAMYINQLQSMIQVCNTVQISQAVTGAGGMFGGAQLTATGGTAHSAGRWSGYVWGRKKGEIERNSLYAWSDGWSGGTRAYKPVSYFGDMRTGGIVYPEVFFGTTGNTPLFFNYDFSGTIKLSKDNYVHGDSAYGGVVGGGIIIYNSDGTDPRDEGVPGEIETFHRDEYSGSKNFVGIRPYNLGLSYEATKIQVECNFLPVPFSLGEIMQRIPSGSTILGAWLEYDFQGAEYIQVMTRINPDPSKLYTEVSYDLGLTWSISSGLPPWTTGISPAVSFGLYSRRRDSRTQAVGNVPIHVPNGHIYTAIGRGINTTGSTDTHGVIEITEAIQAQLESKTSPAADYFLMPSQGGDLLVGGGDVDDYIKTLIPPCDVYDGVDGSGNPVPIASWGVGMAIQYDNLTIDNVIIKYQLQSGCVETICYPLTGAALL